MALKTISGSAGANVGLFNVYFDSPCFSGSDGGPITGSTFATASIYSGSQLTDGIEIDFPGNAQVAYIRTLGYGVTNDNTGSQYCSQCFGPVSIPGAPVPSPTPSPSVTPSLTPTVTPTVTPTPSVSTPPVSLASIRLYANWNGSQWVGLSSADAYCDVNYSVRRIFKTNAPSFAALGLGSRIYSGSGATTSFSTLTHFAGGDSIYNTESSSFETIQVDANGFVTSIDSVDCVSTGEPGGGQTE